MLLPSSKPPFDSAGPTIQQWAARPILPLGRSPMTLRKRITMNPPEEFVALAAAMNPQVEQVNNPIIIGQGGQAVMVPPTTMADTTEASPTVAPTSLDSTAQATTPVQTTAQATSTPTTTIDAVSTAPAPTTAPTSLSEDFSTSIVISTEATTSWIPMTSADISSDVSLASVSVTSRSTVSSTPTLATTASAGASSDAEQQPFTRSAPFIFLCILGALIIVAVLATSLSWIFRRPFFPCCDRFHDDEDDGLSDLVTSFHSHTPSRSSTIRRAGMFEDDAESALHYRASAFATDPTQSPYLHSGMIYGVPVLPGAPSIQVPAPAHLYGATGPLEVKNGMPENSSEEDLSPNDGVVGTPRFLGLDGQGLDVPWSRQNSKGLVGLGIETHPHSVLTSPYISAPDERDYLGAPAFASPSAMVEEKQEYMTTEDSPPPQRAGTWASNLRNTLFAAIAGKAQEDEDRFTRPVLPLHRNSTRRQGFPIVEEKGAENIESVFLAPSYSSSSGSTIAPARRGEGAGERYKRYYARSATSAGSESAWSEDNRMPSRLAGGERAKGVKGN